MSDLGTIGINIEVRGKEAVRQIENDISNVERSAKNASESFKVFERAGLKAAETFRYMGEETKKWLQDQQRILSIKTESEKLAKRQAAEEAKVAQEILKQRQAYEQAAAAKAASFQAGIGANLGLGAQGVSAAASASAFEQEIERLRQKYDKVYVASQLYEQQLNEIVQAERLGILSKQQYQKQLDALNMEYEQFANSAENAYIANNRFSQHVNATSRSLNNFGFVAQQVGYQVGDFFVQVQSGTNVLVAFGQQATQLAGLIPGAWGAAIGIGVSLATALGAAWMRTTEDVSNGSKQQSEAIDRLIDKVRELRLERQMEATGTLTADEQLSLNEINDLMKERAELQKQVTDLTSEEMLTASRGYSAMAAIFLNWTDEKKQARIDEINEILRQLDYERQLEAAAKRRANEVRDYYREQEKVKQAHADQVKLMGDQLAAQGRMKTAAEAVLEKYGMMRTVAAGVANELARAADETFRMSSLNYGKIQNTAGSGPDAARSQVWATMPNPFGTLAGGAGGVSPNTSSSGGTGGGSKVNPVESLINQLQTQREVIDEWYATSQDTLKNASESELQIIGGYNEAKLRLEKEYQDRLKGIRDEGHVTALGDAETFFGGMAAIAQAGGDRTVKAMRVFSAAQAMINSYVAFTEVLKDPSFIGRPFARFGAAASALSSGLAAVAAIKGGGSAGGSMGRGSATVATSSAPAQAPQTVYIDSISPESLYSGETLIKLFDSFYDENDKRGKVFVVAR